MLRQEVHNIVQKAVAAIGGKEVALEHPEEVSHGDFATAAPLQLAKELGKNPKEIAAALASALEQQNSSLIDRVEVAGPGFVNIFLSKETLLQELQQAQKKEYGKGTSWNKQKVMVEFTDPNPFKEFHIGHLYSNAVGESLARLLESQGAQVKRANYQGDVGMHVAKALWGMMKGQHSAMPKDTAPLQEKVHWLGICYAAGALA